MTLPQSITPVLAGYWLLPAFGSRPYTDAAGEITTQYDPRGYMAVFFMAVVFFVLGAFLLKNVKKVK
jgi:uncharacterized membrane protein